MIKNLGRLQVRFYMTWQEKRTGICSQQSDNPDKHMLLWDFDRSSLKKITNSLIRLQIKYNLPNIMIVQSSVKGSYHAYCLTARSFLDTIHILSDTPEIDISYLRLGIIRGYFTLRISPRKNDEIKVVKVLASVVPDEMSITSMTTNEYLTSNKGRKNNAKR